MNDEQKAAIEALKAEYDNSINGARNGDICDAIDRAVSIATQRREASPEDVERVVQTARDTWDRISGNPTCDDPIGVIVRAAITAMSPAAEVERWLSIETAPKDGTVILDSGLDNGGGPDRHYAVVHFEGEWQDTGDCACPFGYLTHWMPLPAPPAGEPTK